jgi:hypothetical protein
MPPLALVASTMTWNPFSSAVPILADAPVVEMMTPILMGGLLSAGALDEGAADEADGLGEADAAGELSAFEPLEALLDEPQPTTNSISATVKASIFVSCLVMRNTPSFLIERFHFQLHAYKNRLLPGAILLPLNLFALCPFSKKHANSGLYRYDEECMVFVRWQGGKLFYCENGRFKIDTLDGPDQWHAKRCSKNMSKNHEIRIAKN